MTRLEKAYSVAVGQQDVLPPPIQASSAPSSTNIKFPLGQVWINTSTGLAYMLTQISGGAATWGLMSPGASDVDTINSLPPTAGNIIIAGGTNLTDSNAGSTVTLNMDAAITLATSVTSPLYTVGAATDLKITGVAGQDVIVKLGDAAGADKFLITDSADVTQFSVDSNGGLTMGAVTFTGLITGQASASISTGATALSLGIDNAAGAVKLGGGTTIRAITIGQDAAAHTIAIGQAAAGAITIDTAAGVSIDAATPSNFTVSAALADLTLQSTGGRVIVKGEEAAVSAVELVSVAGGISAASALQLSLISSQASATAVKIQASNAGGGIDIDAGTTGIICDTTGEVSLDAAADSNFTVTGAGIDVSIISTGGQVIINGEEAAANAVRLLSAAGGIDADCALQMNLTSSQVAADAVRIFASDAAGGIDCDSGTGGTNITSTGVIDIDCAGALSINSSGAAINIGNDADAFAMNIGTGAADRTIVIGNTQAATQVELKAGSTGDIVFTGTVKEINSEFMFSSGTDLTITQSPILQSNATTGVAPTGTTGAVNLMYMQDGCLMEQFILGAGQTIICPRMSANGLNIALDLTDDEGAEYNFGARAGAKHAYTIGTSAAFFVEAQIYVADLSGCEPLWLGFRKVQANAADYTTYSDFYTIGLNNATSATAVSLGKQLNTGGVTLQSSTDAWGGDGTIRTLKVLVSAAGVVTATIDGVAPTAPLALTFDNADVVMPFIHFLHDTTTPGEIALLSLKCGFQA
jgi:hypothetical protein